MEAAYPELERVSRACLQTVAAALGAPHTAFDELVTSDSTTHPDAPLRHHSRLQVINCSPFTQHPPAAPVAPPLAQHPFSLPRYLGKS